MRNKRPKYALYLTVSLIILSTLLTACGGGSSARNSTPTTNLPAATPTITETPKKTLVVCVAEEPQSLYFYASASRSMWSVLEAIYDGPIDTVNYEPQPVILTQIPSMENGDVSIGSVAVSAGDEVVNIEGDLVTLAKGVKVFPEGCTEEGCAVEWDGKSELKLTQMTVTFRLKEGIKWSDGEALTAADSVYSYSVAGDPATQVSKTLIKKTESYTEVDPLTVQWVGKPGFLTLNPASVFWIPLPEHQLSSLNVDELNTSALTNRDPMGWGPYKIDEWVAGDHIRMVKNPNYFRADEGLPKFDVIVYRFVGSAVKPDVGALQTGECDVMDSSVEMDDQILALGTLKNQGVIKLTYGLGPDWEVLNFGIKPASYDEVYNPFLDRPDFFGDVRVRQAVAYCINRDAIIKKLFLGTSAVPTSYVTPNNPYLVDGLATYSNDPEKGKQLLDEVGWKDADGDPSTPRVSYGVANILDGTDFEVSLTATESSFHTMSLEMIKNDLDNCGIKVNTSSASAADLFGTGPDSTVFGRNFDLVELAWTIGKVPPCFLYTSSEILNAKNQWLGTKFGGVNFTGFSNAEYDQACGSMLSAGLSQENFDKANQVTQTILADELPVVPLYYRVKILAVRSDLCGLALDISSRSALASIETADISNTCSK